MIMIGLTGNEIDRYFTQYLESALSEFEQPHEHNDFSRLDIYNTAFREVVGMILNKLNKKIAAQQSKESPENNNQQPNGEICSDNPCSYCTTSDNCENKKCTIGENIYNSDSKFKGRKLHH